MQGSRGLRACAPQIWRSPRMSRLASHQVQVVEAQLHWAVVAAAAVAVECPYFDSAAAAFPVVAVVADLAAFPVPFLASSAVSLVLSFVWVPPSPDSVAQHQRSIST